MDEPETEAAWEDLRCPECGNVEHAESCSQRERTRPASDDDETGSSRSTRSGRS